MNELLTTCLRLVYTLLALVYLFTFALGLSVVVALIAVTLHHFGLFRLPGMQFGEFGVRVVDEDELRKAGL